MKLSEIAVRWLMCLIIAAPICIRSVSAAETESNPKISAADDPEKDSVPKTRKIYEDNNADPSDSRIMTETWAIQIREGVNPDKLAEKYNAVNMGQIAHLPDTYLFKLPSTLNRTKALNQEEQFRYEKRIKWYRQLEAKRRFTRAVSLTDPMYLQQWHLTNTGQSGGTRGADINVLPVWNQGITGEGVVIGIVDDGLQYIHPDIAPNYRPDLSYDFFNKDPDPAPLSIEKHGTAVAGIAAARDNTVCGVGVAYRAGIAGLRLISGQITDADEANALSYKRDQIAIYLNSWGGSDDGKHLEAPGPLTSAAMEDNIRNGRNGLGSIYVWSAGNGKKEFDDVNYDGYANARYTVAVSSTDHNGAQSPFSEPGAAILVNAPGEGSGVGVVTCDLLGASGYDAGDCAEIFEGSSSSSAIAAGVIALMLEANPDLNWRDIQHILIKSAVKNDPTDEDWTVNAAGLPISHKYGFGRINAEAAVSLAKSWISVPNVITLAYDPVTVNRSIPDSTAAGVSSEFTAAHDFKLEHAEIVFNAVHPFRGDLRVILTSPSGTASILAESHRDYHADYTEWRFMTVRNWNELSKGTWKLTVADPVNGDAGIFVSWRLILHGTPDPGAGNQPPFPKNDTISTSLNTPVQINVLQNDIDVNGDILTVSAVTSPNRGTAVINPDNSVIYAPQTGYIGEDSFFYTVSDGISDMQAKVTVSVGETCMALASEGGPKLIPDGGDLTGLTSQIFVPFGGTVADVNVLVNITHPYVSDLKGVLISPNGTKVTLFNHSGGSSSDFSDTVFDDQASTPVNDGKGPFTGYFRPVSPLNVLEGEDIAGAWKLHLLDEVREDTGSLNMWRLDICYVPLLENRPPAVQDDRSVTAADTPVTINVLANDFDPNGDAISIVNISLPRNGTALIQNGMILYTPASGFTGEDIFSYIVSDGTNSVSGNVTVYVGQKEYIYFSTDTPISIPDWDPRGVTSAIKIPGYGKILDINVRLNIDHPWSEDLRAYLISPLGTRLTLFENVSAVGNKFMSIVLDDEASLSISDGMSPFNFSYRPFSLLSALNGEPVNGEWKLTITDDRGEDVGALESWQLLLYYLPYSENQTPVPRDDFAETLINTPVIIPVLSNDYDLRIQDLTVTQVSAPPNGTAEINPDQTITYTPASGFMGKDEFTYTVSNSVKSAQGKVSVIAGRTVFRSPDVSLIIPDNNPGGLISTVMIPTFGIILDLNVRLTISHSCPHDLKAYLISPSDEKITLFESVGATDKTDFINTVLDDEASMPIADSAPPFTGSYKPFSLLSVLDGKELAGEWKLLLTDTEVYDRGTLISWQIEAAYSPPESYKPPVANNDAVRFPYTGLARNMSPIIIPVTANDIAMNIDTLTVTQVSVPGQGTAGIQTAKSVFYTPDACFRGQDTFTYTVRDDMGGVGSATVTVTLDNNMIKDSGFELGTPNPFWTESSVCWNGTPLLGGGAHTGSWLAWFENCSVKESASLAQTILIPEAASAVLKFWFLMHHADTPGNFRVKMDDQIIFTAAEEDLNKYIKWSEIQIRVDSFADGKDHTLRIENVFRNEELKTGITTFLVDDVSLILHKCDAEPTGLKELISVLQILAGMPAGFYPLTDLNSDGKIGLEEAIRVLQTVAEF